MCKRSCLLCKNKGEGTFYKFPKDPLTKARCIDSCKLNSRDTVKNVFICYKHFDKDDYIDINAVQFGGRLKLKHGATPKLEPIENLNVASSIKPNIIPPLKRMSTEVAYSSTTSNASCATPDNSKELPEGNCTPKRRRFCEPRYMGEATPLDVATPRRARKTLHLAQATIAKHKREIKNLREKNGVMKKNISTLKGVLNRLRRNGILSEEAADQVLQNVPANIKVILFKKSKKYEAQIRSFALTLSFYSAKAYSYDRKVWGNRLPHPTTLRNWYKVVNGKPGFTKEAFEVLQKKYQRSDMYSIVNIVIDEMSIKSGIIFKNNKFYGGVNLGTNLSVDNDSITEAKNALVFMAVGLNASWKVPLEYFLISSLAGSECSNLLTQCILLVNDVNVNVYSITFDRALVNLNMCTNLGVKFEYEVILNPTFHTL